MEIIIKKKELDGKEVRTHYLEQKLENVRILLSEEEWRAIGRENGWEPCEEEAIAEQAVADFTGGGDAR